MTKVAIRTPQAKEMVTITRSISSLPVTPSTPRKRQVKSAESTGRADVVIGVVEDGFNESVDVSYDGCT